MRRLAFVILLGACGAPALPGVAVTVDGGALGDAAPTCAAADIPNCITGRCVDVPCGAACVCPVGAACTRIETNTTAMWSVCR